MPNTQHLQQIRELVRSCFAELGVPSDAEISEHILLRDELYCGRRFRCGGLQAVWFIEEDEVKIYGRDGALVCVVPGTQLADSAQLSRRRAA